MTQTEFLCFPSENEVIEVYLRDGITKTRLVPEKDILEPLYASLLVLQKNCVIEYINTYSDLRYRIQTLKDRVLNLNLDRILSYSQLDAIDNLQANLSCLESQSLFIEKRAEEILFAAGQIKTNLKDFYFSKPSLIRESLLSCFEEYPFEIEDNNLIVFHIPEEIILSEEDTTLNLGTFSVCLFPDTGQINIIAKNPIYANSDSDQEISHPHIKNVRPCLGEATVPVRECLTQLDFIGFCDVIKAFLKEYNPSSAYQPLSRWLEEGEDCCNCGDITENVCETCDSPTCDSCLVNCQCGSETFCPECGLYCLCGCGTIFGRRHSNCGVACDRCGVIWCDSSFFKTCPECGEIWCDECESRTNWESCIRCKETFCSNCLRYESFSSIGFYCLTCFREEEEEEKEEE